MLSMNAGVSSAPLKKPLHFGRHLSDPVYYSLYIDPGVVPSKVSPPKPQPGAEFPPAPADLLKTSLELRSRFVSKMNELTQKLKKEVGFWGQPGQETLKQIRELRERHARELLPLDRHYLTIMRTMPPEAIAYGIVAGLKDTLGPKGFKAFQQYLKGRPDDLLAFAMEHQKKLMAIIPTIGKQYGREVQDALELPVLALPLILKKSSQVVAEKGQAVLQFFTDVLLPMHLLQSIRNAHDRIKANSPGFSKTQGEHLEVLAKIFQEVANKLPSIREALVKRLF